MAIDNVPFPSTTRRHKKHLAIFFSPLENLKVAGHLAKSVLSAKCLVAQSFPTLCNPMDCSSPRLLCPWGFSRQEYWRGLPCPPPGDRPNPGIEPRSPTLLADSLPSEPPGSPGKIWGPDNS